MESGILSHLDHLFPTLVITIPSLDFLVLWSTSLHCIKLFHAKFQNKLETMAVQILFTRQAEEFTQ